MYTFERVTRSHFDLVSRWLAEPHVARWWYHDPSPEAVAADFGPTSDGLEPAEDYIAFHAGDAIVVETLDTNDDPDDIDQSDQDRAADEDAIEGRAQELATHHPALRAQLELFAETQRDEVTFLQTHTIDGIWAVQRQHDPASSTTR